MASRGERLWRASAPVRRVGPTLDEVAARAGVGRGTVSRVVNGSPQVSATARAAVQRAIDELGYVPNRAARALVTQRTDSVALVVSESEERVFGEPFFAGIIRGINSILLETPLQMWLAMAQSKNERDRVEHHLTPQHVDGVLLMSLHGEDRLPTLLAQRGLPVVVVWPARRQSEDRWRPDELRGRRQRGWRPGRRGTPPRAGPYPGGRDRRPAGHGCGPEPPGSGYRGAMKEAAQPVDESAIGYGDFSEASGADAMRTLLDRHPTLDAVFCASDLMAVGAMRTLREYGRRIPTDVAVVGFEDSVLARQTDPALTTVHQPVEAMGREMARLLVAHIRGELIPAPLVILDTHLVVRASG